MPLTLAHPAAVIPVYRMAKSLSLPALVIGSVSPDLPYFLPLASFPMASFLMGSNGLDTHNVFAILWFCLPASLIIYIVYFSILAPVLVELLPRVFRYRLDISHVAGRLPMVPWRIVIVSSAIGAVTHILWDAMTHANGALVHVLPPLQMPLVTVGGYTLYTFKLLQHGSTVLGMGLLMYWIIRRSSKTESITQRLSGTHRGVIAVILMGSPLGLGLISGLSHCNSDTWLQQLQQFLGSFVVTAGGAAIMCWMFVGMAYRVYLGRIPS